MPSIAIVGAGPGLGLAIARTFGSEGYDVALVSRHRAKLDGLIDQLASENIAAAAFPADVLDRAALSQALDHATRHLGRIDVLEYSPSGTVATTRMTSPSRSAPEDVQEQIEFQLYGAIAATSAVLPAMREAGAGTLLYTTGAGSVNPVPQIGNVNAAAAALRNWAINLHNELAGTGVYAAHIAIDVSIDVPALPGFPTAPAEDIAAVYWELHSKREQPEHIFTLSSLQSVEVAP
ncbi:MAG: SDR family NAD(P)-dependent oxidoreductase [Gaiellales bacterium]